MPEKRAAVNHCAAEVPSSADCPDAGRAALVYATFPDLATAERIGGALVEAGLAACVNLLPGMRSLYRWEGRLACDAEVAALIKTRLALAERVTGYLLVAHPYRTPAVLVVEPSGGSPDFLAWIRRETAG